MRQALTRPARRSRAALVLLTVLLVSAGARADGVDPETTIRAVRADVASARTQADEPSGPSGREVCPLRCTPCATSDGAGQPADASAWAAEETPGTRRIVDLNRADESALLDLPGIGPARARAILAYRVSHGGFHSLAQLLHIKGIGRALLKQLRPLVTL